MKVRLQILGLIILFTGIVVLGMIAMWVAEDVYAFFAIYGVIILACVLIAIKIVKLYIRNYD